MNRVKSSSKKSVQQIRKGRWRDVDQEELDKIHALPQEVQKRLKEPGSDWDWIEFSEGGDLWLIIREYDNGKEISRTAAIVKAHKYFV